jgi:hypothetical protein
MVGTCYIYGDMKCGYTIFVGKPEGTRSFGRPRRRWREILNRFQRNCSLGVFENRMLRKILWPERDEVTRE